MKATDEIFVSICVSRPSCASVLLAGLFGNSETVNGSLYRYQVCRIQSNTFKKYVFELILEFWRFLFYCLKKFWKIVRKLIAVVCRKKVIYIENILTNSTLINFTLWTFLFFFFDLAPTRDGQDFNEVKNKNCWNHLSIKEYIISFIFNWLIKACKVL